MSSRSYLFAFETPGRARQFVRLVASCLRQIALYIDDCHVYVVDGSPAGQHHIIIRLARSSAARHLPPIDPDGR